MSNHLFRTLSALRAALHACPEPSGQETATRALLENFLTQHTTLTLHPCGAGFYAAHREAAVTRPGIVLRADYDALALPGGGAAHLCGHDGHAAALCGAALLLEGKSVGREVFFLFQPAEETVGGAAQMIADGCMENPPVGAVFGFHVAAREKTGYAEFCRGKMNAATCDLLIEVEGVSCHGAHPEGGVDAIVVGSQIVTALQSIPSRNLSPTNAGIVTVGQFHAGTKDNIVAGYARLSGTLRALDPVTMNTLKTRAKELAEGIAEGYGAKAHVTLTDGYPALINNDELCEEMVAMTEELIGRDKIVFMPEPSLGADDFAFFAQCSDALYMSIGTNPGTEPYEQNIHNEHYKPDEASMHNGVLLEVMWALTALEKAQ
jgi:amidohydrolase